MAQTEAEIQAQMQAELADQPALASLNSTSNTAIYSLWMFIVATILVFFEQLMDSFQADVQNIINNNQYGTNGWWYQQIMAFQYGNTLVFQNNVFQYPGADTAAQVVGFCSITSVNGIVQIKAAANIGGAPTPLTTQQVTGLTAYCSEIQPAGIRWAVLSQAADLLKLYGTVWFDATQDIDVIQPAVYAAIVAFLASLNNVQTTNGAPVTQNFDGTLFINKMIDAIQAVPGLIGNQFDLISIAAAPVGQGYTAFTSSYTPESGYFTIDPAYPLATTLTFSPYTAS
jgi:hypothetical protein